MKIKLYTCVNKDCDYIGFNQYITYWEEKGYIERIHIPMLRDKRFIAWVGRVGGLALEPSNILSISTPYEYVLSCQYVPAYVNNPKILPWSFYVRNWADYSKVQLELPLPKTTASLFSGTVRENPPYEGRRGKWKEHCEVFSFRRARTYNRHNGMFATSADYYRALAKSKYGLCPIGDTEVTQREIETMGLGCVPIYTKEVYWKRHNTPVENVHFIYCDNPQEMKDKIASISDKDREAIAKNAMEYFNKNCSPDGLWNAVLETIEKFSIKL